ncbi:MAG: DUF554 domain-containing protein [Butyricicoccus sp.]
MPIGCIINACSIAVGGVLGAALRRYIPQRLCDGLPAAFGFCSMLIGVSLMRDLVNLPPCVLSVILGTIVGELICLEDRINRGIRWVQSRLMSGAPMDDEQMDSFLSVLVLFCASGTGIFGALNEGMTGDPSILFAKSVLDLPTAAIFATSLGIFVAAIALPQICIFAALFCSAGLIVPLMTDSMMGDFRAVGGLMTLIAGFRILRIKQVRLLNILPSIVLAPIISALWTHLMG